MELILHWGEHALLHPENDDFETAQLAAALHEAMGTWAVATPRPGSDAINAVDLFVRHATGADHPTAELDGFAISVVSKRHVPAMKRSVAQLRRRTGAQRRRQSRPRPKRTTSVLASNPSPESTSSTACRCAWPTH
jgi:hypothetical protein